MPMALPLGELSPKVTERARLCTRFRIFALSVSLSLDSSPKGRAKKKGESQERGGRVLGSHFGKEKKYYDTFVQPEILKNQNLSLDFMAIKCIMQSNR